MIPLFPRAKGKLGNSIVPCPAMPTPVVVVQSDSVASPKARADSLITLSRVQTVKPCRSAMARCKASPERKPSRQLCNHSAAIWKSTVSMGNSMKWPFMASYCPCTAKDCASVNLPVLHFMPNAETNSVAVYSLIANG